MDNEKRKGLRFQLLSLETFLSHSISPLPDLAGIVDVTESLNDDVNIALLPDPDPECCLHDKSLGCEYIWTCLFSCYFPLSSVFGVC